MYVSYWAMLYPTELPNTLWATLYPKWATYSTYLYEMLVYRTVRYRIKGTPLRYQNATVPDWDAGCRNIYASSIGLDVDAQLW
jgi:hypothetical protein